MSSKNYDWYQPPLPWDPPTLAQSIWKNILYHNMLKICVFIDIDLGPWGSTNWDNFPIWVAVMVDKDDWPKPETPWIQVNSAPKLIWDLPPQPVEQLVISEADALTDATHRGGPDQSLHHIPFLEVLEVVLFNMANSNQYNILSILIFCKISLSISILISIFFKISL